jgi:hypothetical protein
VSDITLRRAAEQMLECLLYHYNAGNSNTITGVRLKLDEKAIREARAALAEPPAKPEPATMQQIVATHRTTYGAPWLDEFDRAWKAAERFHGIRGSKT